MNIKDNKFLQIILAGLALAVVFTGGLYLGYENRPSVKKVTDLFNKNSGQPADVNFEAFWKAWTIVNEKYVDGNSTSSTSTKKTTNQDKVWGAIEGMISSLGDPYSVFLPPEENKRFEEDIQGNFSGVGMEVGMKDNTPTVISPLPNSPAKKAGVLAGDAILKINETSTSNLSIDEAVTLIRGKEGTTVTLTLLRAGNKDSFELKIMREVITIPTLDTKLITDPKTGQKVFVISLFKFSEPSPNLFRGGLKKFLESGTSNLVLDLRGNPGGYLEAAVDMASWFLPEGKVVVRESRGGGVAEHEYRSVGYDIFNKNNLKLHMIILVDRGSASASEILAGALSEYNVAKLVGEKTFGKGSVQQLIPVTSDSSIKLTIAKWLTPNGHSISKNGLSVDYEVKLTEENAKNGKDPQMDKAVELLIKN